jgi:putative transposase
MPEHIHLLISDAEDAAPSTVIQVLKQKTAWTILPEVRKSRGPIEHLWQERFYDFNVWSAKKEAEKLTYMHNNPVKRGLVSSPEDWRWSSCRCYATGKQGTVKVKVQERPLRIKRVTARKFAG